MDSKHIGQHLDKNSDEALAQIAFADRIMINKVDLVDEVDLTTLERRVKRINKVAQVYRSTMADAPISELLDIGGFNLDHALEIDPEFFDDAEDSKSIITIIIMTMKIIMITIMTMKFNHWRFLYLVGWI